MRMNMKAIRYTLGILLACLTLVGCQDVEEPLNTVPAVVTGEVEVTSNYIILTGSVSSKAECYFLISKSGDMADAERLFAEIDFNDSDSPADWEYYCGLGDLEPGTTYYVVFCATDGRSEVRGNVVSFTTLDALHLASITYTPWGEESAVDFINETALGGFLLHGNLQGDIWQNNLLIPYDFDNAEWSLPELDPFEGEMAMIAYWPYQQSANPWEFAVYNGMDYLFGTCEGLNTTNLAANIHLNHVMAKVKFDIVLEDENGIGGTINTVVIGNRNNPETYDRYEAIPWEGILNMATGTLTPIYNDHDGIWLDCSITPSTDVQSVETFIVPTKFGADMAHVQLWFDNDYILSWTFTETSWDPGVEYTYPLTITENGLVVGDVIVEEWLDNDEGTIIINK